MASKVLVVGSGVIGLRTALELLRKNIPVVLKSAHPPTHPKCCSMGAGGLWMPYKCDDPRIAKWASETLDELLPMASTSESESESASSKPGRGENSKSDELASTTVEIVPTVYLTSKNLGPKVEDFVASKYDQTQHDIVTPLPEWTKDPRLTFQHLTVEMLSWQNSVFKLRIPSEKRLLEAGYTHAWFFKPPVVDPPMMLKNMLNEIEAHPMSVDVDLGTMYQSMDEMVQDANDMGCDALVNCTGLGAANICNDSDIYGGRGVLLHYDRSCARREDVDVQGENDAAILTEDGNWGTTTEPCYVIPRGEVMVVGGTYKEKDTEGSLRDEEREMLLENASILGIDTEKASPVGEWTGFRPCRPSVRLEVDDVKSTSDVTVLQSYGAGGSGWTIFVGVAKEATRLLLGTR